MYTNEEFASVYTFLKSTGEGNSRKMFVGPKFTDTHFKILMKIVRSCNETQFAENWQAASFPKVKFASDEIALKEGFWKCTADACVALGLLTAAKKAA